MAVPMANGPPFATLYQFAADLGIPSESQSLRIGINHVNGSIALTPDAKSLDGLLSGVPDGFARRQPLDGSYCDALYCHRPLPLSYHIATRITRNPGGASRVAVPRRAQFAAVYRELGGPVVAVSAANTSLGVMHAPA